VTETGGYQRLPAFTGELGLDRAYTHDAEGTSTSTKQVYLTENGCYANRETTLMFHMVSCRIEATIADVLTAFAPHGDRSWPTA
jgi:hypothetical protein